MPKNLYMEKIGKKAKLASLNLSSLNLDKKNAVLKHVLKYIIQFKTCLKSHKQNIEISETYKSGLTSEQTHDFETSPNQEKLPVAGGCRCRGWEVFLLAKY